jgi:hypothetical protein
MTPSKRPVRRWVARRVGRLSVRGKLGLLIVLIVLAGMAVELFQRWAG